MVKLPVLTPLLAGVTVLRGTLAQSANCTRDIGLKNSQGEDACAVGIKVGQICDPGFTIPPITPGHFYGGPQAGRSTQCTCSTVYFTLLTVCGVCQGVDEIPWTTYNFNCSTKFESNGNVSESFPVAIPPGLDIPHWAFTPLLQNGSIDPLRIQADTQPDVTGSAPSTSSASVTPSSPVKTTSPSPSPSQSQDPDNGGSDGGGKSNAGAIAGGVVGGVVLLALLAVLAFFLRRRLARNKSPNVAAMESGPGHPQTTQTILTSQGWTSPDTLRSNGNSNGMPSYYVDHSLGSRSPTPPKLYNPDDPATFPPPVSPSILRSTSPGQPTINSTFSTFPHTTPSELGEWHPYRTSTPEI